MLGTTILMGQMIRVTTMRIFLPPTKGRIIGKVFPVTWGRQMVILRFTRMGEFGLWGQEQNDGASLHFKSWVVHLRRAYRYGCYSILTPFFRA